MCTPASLVLTRDKVFWSKNSDSHKDIIEEFGLSADGIRGPNIVRVEIVPPKTGDRKDYSRPLEEWVYHTDQDIVPSWYNEVEGERRTRVATVEWIKAKVITEGEITIESGEIWAYGSSVVNSFNSSAVHSYNSSTVYSNDSSKVYSYGSSIVYSYGSSKVYSRDSSTVHSYDSSIVHSYDSSIVSSYNSSNVYS